MIIEIPGEARLWTPSVLRELATHVTGVLREEGNKIKIETGMSRNSKNRFFEMMAYLNTYNHRSDEKIHSWFFQGTNTAAMIGKMNHPTVNGLYIGMVSHYDFENIKQEFLKKEYQEMPVLQSQMQQGEQNHEIMITKKNNSTYVITTLEPRWADLYKILLMHYEWHKNKYPDANENYVKLLRGYMAGDLEKVQEAFDTLIFKNEEIQRRQIRLCAENFTFNRDAELARVDREINDRRNRLKDTLEYYETLNRELQELLRDYENVRIREDKVDVDKITDFLLHHQYITPERDGNAVRLNYIAPILDYDEAVATHQKRGRSEYQQRILDIFIKHRDEFRLWTHAAVVIDAQNGRIYGSQNSLIQTYKDHHLYGHPHINEYGCVGTHPHEIIPFMNQGNFIGAINAVTAMVFNLNFGDGPVVNELMNHLVCQDDFKFWEEIETGKFLTTPQVLRKIKEKENGTTETDKGGTE